MSAPTPEDGLLLVLLRNLRNAAFTFGEGSSQHTRIRATVQEHLDEMKQKGLTTNITITRKQESRMQGVEQTTSQLPFEQPNDLPELIGILASLQLK